MSLTTIEMKLLSELIERRGMDSVLLAISAVSAVKSVELEAKGDSSGSDKWSAFMDLMNDEYIWCKKHLY